MEGINDIRVKNLSVGEDLSWSDSLLKGLAKIKEERIFFLYDDCFIYKINKEKITYFFNKAILNDMLSLHLRPSYFVSKFGKNQPILMPSKAFYRNALFCNLIKRNHLISLLMHNESAWDFELKGNIRSIGFNYFSIRRSLIGYHHGIVKGKWFHSIYKNLIQKGYNFEKLDKKMTLMSSIRLKFRTQLHDLYMYFLPLNVLIKIENKRKKLFNGND